MHLYLIVFIYNLLLQLNLLKKIIFKIGVNVERFVKSAMQEEKKKRLASLGHFI